MRATAASWQTRSISSVMIPGRIILAHSSSTSRPSWDGMESISFVIRKRSSQKKHNAPGRLSASFQSPAAAASEWCSGSWTQSHCEARLKKRSTKASESSTAQPASSPSVLTLGVIGVVRAADGARHFAERRLLVGPQSPRKLKARKLHQMVQILLWK